MARRTNGRRVQTSMLLRQHPSAWPTIYTGQVLTTAPVAPGVILPVGGYAEFGAGFITITNGRH